MSYFLKLAVLSPKCLSTTALLAIAQLEVVIREFSIAVNVQLVNVVERMSARNVGSTAHYVFVH